MGKCAICKKSKIKGAGAFYNVPKDEGRRKKWAEICRTNFSANALICMDHFSPAHIIQLGNRSVLMPNALPNAVPRTGDMRIDGLEFSCAMDLQQPTTSLHGLRLFTIEKLANTWPSKSNEEFQKEKEFQTEKNINVAVPKDAENTRFENPNEITTNLLNLRNNVVPPQLQEEPIIQMPVIKSVSCTGFTQTNTRLCGLVEASDYSHEFRFNCFYCSAVFPLEKWKYFVNHLKQEHSEIEEVFKTSIYVSDDHDYTPINLPPSTPVESDHENVIRTESPPVLEDPLKPTNNPFESVMFDPNFYYASDEKNSISNNTIILNNIETNNSTTPTELSGMTNSNKESLNKYKMKYYSKKMPNKTSLGRCPKRTNNIEELKREHNQEYKPISIEIVQQKSTEITFEYTPRAIVDLLLDSMKDYPILWQYDYERFNEGFYEACEELCKIINDKWSLNIDNLKMRRSINRIIRYYCCSFPNTNVENISEFTHYYDKCAAFLPSSVNEIAYARCSHCYISYGNDFDLKRHLLEEQKYLQWPYECAQCKECFRENDEYEFHKLLIHYDEIYRCKLCNKRFELRSKYNKHVSNYHPGQRNLPGEYKCDICSKTFHTKNNLRGHKLIHGERTYKCHLCPKSFFMNSALQLHLKCHRKEYNCMCEVCGKVFMIPSNLRQHMTKHTGAKVTCSICNLKLRKSSLSRHMRLVHVACEGTVESTYRARCYHYNKFLHPKPKKERKKKNYCNICRLSFENYKLIREHNQELHSDIPKWPCKMCNAQFDNKTNLKRHYRRKHILPMVQVSKLINENENLNVILDELPENREKHNVKESNVQIPVKSELMPDDIFFEADKIHSSTIQDEIIEAADIATQEIKIDDIFIDLLNDQQKKL